MTRSRALLRVACIAWTLHCLEAFSVPQRRLSASSARRLAGRVKLDDEEDGLLDKVDEMLEPVDDLLDKVDEMLDRPFYDPSQDEDSWLSKLSGGDAELAGTLFASGFLALMVVVSQELVRWYKYGANYVPFRPGGGGGGPSLIDGL